MRTLNVRLAVILLIALAGLGIGVRYLHTFQMRRNAHVYKEAADRAIERAKKAGENKNAPLEEAAYREAMQNLGRYLLFRPDDVDAIEQLVYLMAERCMTPVRSIGRLVGWNTCCVSIPSGAASAGGWFDLAIATHRYQDAKEHLERFLLPQSPDDPKLLILYGRCQMELGNDEAAVQALKKAIGLSDDNAEAGAGAAKKAADAGADKTADGQAEKKAAGDGADGKAQPGGDENIEAYVLLARILRSRFSRPKEADQWMENLVKFNPKSAKAHLMRCDYLKNAGLLDEALEEALSALELAPDDRDALLMAAQCSLAANQVEPARRYALRGIELYSYNVLMYATLADVEIQAGNRDKAIEAFEKGLKATAQLVSLGADGQPVH